MNSDQKALMKLFNDNGMECRFTNEVLNISFECFHVWITQRPHYCDRGRWLVNAHSTDPTRATVDGADGFPRYYFLNASVVAEMAYWKEARLKGMKQLPVGANPNED